MAEVVEVRTPGRGLHEITATVSDWVARRSVIAGVCHVFCRHTSASLTIQENADPSARRDLESWLERSVREDDPAWTHVAEGSDDMPAHVRSMLTDVSLSIPVIDGCLALGTWQGIYLCEHRSMPHRRSLALALIPES